MGGGGGWGMRRARGGGEGGREGWAGRGIVKGLACGGKERGVGWG